MLLTRSVLLGIFTLLTLLVTQSASQRSSYGEVCSKTQRCDRRAWLGCFSGKCECLKPDEMLFEPTTGKCVSKAGERCKYALEHSDGSKSLENTTCVENSVCGGDGYCSCGEDYYENVNSTCSPTKKYSEPCDTKAKCSSLSGLVCNDGACQCAEGTSTYSPEERQCVGLVGQVCILSKCIENADCSSNRCVCNEGFYQDSNNRCSRKLDRLQNCTADDQCKYEGDLTLKCVDEMCQCDPDNSVFGTGKKHIGNGRYCDTDFYGFRPESSMQCLGKVGKPCIDDACAPGSFCLYNSRCSSTGPGTCVCRSGYSESNFGTCGRQHNEDCDSPGTCLDGLVCDREVNRCRCLYTYQNYDTSERKCISPVRGPCDAYSGCANGAKCVKVRNSSRGTCQCTEGYVEGTFGKCEVAYGMPCSHGTVCDSMAGLRCIEDICQCGGMRQFNESMKTCLGLAGFPCDLNVKGQQCIQNSNCLKAREQHTTGSCTCNDGHILSENYTCQPEIAEYENAADVPVLAFPVIYDVDTSDEGEQNE